MAVTADPADAVVAARDAVMERWGRIDVGVNCAMCTIVAPIDWARNRFTCKYQTVGTVYQPEVAARAV